jgi:hypothetical protein
MRFVRLARTHDAVARAGMRFYFFSELAAAVEQQLMLEAHARTCS